MPTPSPAAIVPLALLALALPGCPRDGANSATARSAGTSPSASGPADSAADAGRAATSQRVSIHTDDGWILAGELWAPRSRDGAQAPESAVVLVHQLSSNRSEWAPLVARLREQRPAPTVLAIDLRGHGESTQGPEGPTRWQSFGNDPARWAGVVTDVAAAVNFLWSRAQPLTSLVLVGSSIGSNAALHVAADNSNVAGVVLLSPGLNYRGIDMSEMERYEASGRAALLFAGADDTASAVAVRAYTHDDVAHDGVTGEVFPGTSAHGVALAAPGAHPELWDRIATWVHERLQAPTNALNPSLPSSVDGGTYE